MYPYLHIDGLAVGTYGLLMGLAFVSAWKVLKWDMRRRGLASEHSETIIICMVIAGLAGAKLYHELQSPGELVTHPSIQILMKPGLAWFGGMIAGIVTLLLLARRYRMRALVLLDVSCPAAAIGYGIGRLGCLLAGDGDYGIPTSLPWGMRFPQGIKPTFELVHPTPIYEFLASAAIATYLWKRGNQEDPPGRELGRYLVLTGLARFAVEFIRLNPRSFLGLTDAQTLSLACIVAGSLLLLYRRHQVATLAG